MTREWTPVEVQPLIDDDEQRQWWQPIVSALSDWEPKVGDRVRVRLNGECQVLGRWKVDRVGKALGIEGGMRHGHPDHVDGLCGYIIRTSDAFAGHPYRVRLMCDDGPTGFHQGFFAACELELLP